MQREGQKITFDDLADENFRALPKMKKYAQCNLSKQVMKTPVCYLGNHYEKKEIIKHLKETQDIDVADMGLEPAEEAVKVISRMVGQQDLRE